jgi:C4-dicarboxylate-specific signal transduction histidine kinase
MPQVLILAEELIPPIEVDPVLVTPGVVGFFATFLMAAGAVFLIFDMVRRVRRVRYRAEISERLDREMEERARTQDSEK